MKYRLGQEIEVELANLWLCYERYLSSKVTKNISSLEYISTEILKLQESIIKVEEKQFNITSSFGDVQYPSISLSGLHLSLFDEGLVILYRLLAPVLMLVTLMLIAHLFRDFN